MAGRLRSRASLCERWTLRRRRAGDRTLSDYRTARQGRHGRGLSRQRPHARSACGAQVSARIHGAGRRYAGPLSQRSAHRAPGLAPECLPRLRSRRGQRTAIPFDGVHRRRRPRLVAAPHRTSARRQGARVRAPHLRPPRRRARQRRATSRPEAIQHHDRQPRPGLHHRLRPGGGHRRAARSPGARGHPGLHGARATGRQRSDRAQRHLCAGPGALRDVRGQAALRSRNAGRDDPPPATIRAGQSDDRGEGRGHRGGARDPTLPGRGPAPAAVQTPSPDLGAAAGRQVGIRPALGLVCLALTIAGLAAVILIGPRVQLIGRVAMEHPPEALAKKSRDLARAVGYTAKPMGVAHGFGYDPDYLQYVERIDKSPGRWEHRLGNMQPPAILFWYRQSPRPLVPEAFPLGTVDPGDPPPIVSGMVSVMLDPQGRLLEFDAVPPQVDKESGTVPPPDWKRLFDAAGLDMSRFSAATPQWTPLGICDARAAWTGVLSSGPPNPVRVEAAAWRGKPIYYQIVGPWTRPERMQSFMLTASIKAVAITVLVLTGLLLVAAALLARHNIRRERGDRRGALRLAGFTACVFMLIWVFGGSHVASLGELLLFFGALSCALLLAASVWILYMAIEPIARRRWPHSMISWNRLLAGGVRDPLVGRDVLVGVTFGTAAALVAKLHELVLLRFGATPSIAVHPGSLLGVTGAVAAFLTLIPNCVVQALVWFVLIFILRVVLRRDWLAAGGFVLMYVALNALTATASPALAALFSAVETALLVFTMLRFGLVALIASFFVYVLLLMFPITADFSVWYAGASLFALLSVAAMAAFALRSSLGGTGFSL